MISNRLRTRVRQWQLLRFARKPLLYGTVEMVGERVVNTVLTQRPFRQLTPNVEVWKTPGHTQHDLSVVIRNVPAYGSICIVGDLITSDSVYMQTDIISAHPLGVWDVGSQRQNANLMMCICDWIVPGHDTVFQVTEAHRLKASCSRLNLTKLLANRS